MGNMTLELVFGWNINCVFSLNLFVSGTTRRFKHRNVITMACGPICVIFAKMFAMKFEFETTDSFITFGVVTDYFNVCFLTNVILISIKDNFGRAMRCSHAQETSDFILQTELKLSDREDYGWSEDVDLSCTTEKRNAFLMICHVVGVFWCELRLNGVVY
jgi:hypothetical protein